MTIVDYLKTVQFDPKRFERLRTVKEEFPLRAIDKLWYDNRLGRECQRKGWRFVFNRLPISEQDAGEVRLVGKDLHLVVNLEKFRKIKGAVYQMGGLPCSSRDCLLHLLLHESLHVALLHEDPGHGPLFKTLSKQMFGHHHHQHGLFPEFPNPHSIPRLLKLGPGEIVDMYLPGEGTVQGKIVARKGEDAIVRTQLGLFRSFVGLLRPTNTEFTVRVPFQT